MYWCHLKREVAGGCIGVVTLLGGLGDLGIWGVELGCTKICVLSDGCLGRRAVANVVLVSRVNTLLRDGSRSERMCGGLLGVCVLWETIYLCCAKTRYNQ